MLALRGENPQISEADYNALFAQYDRDANGVISKDEMEIILRQARGEIPLTVDQIWAKYDKDGNGTLSKAECRNYVQDMLAHKGENP
jgi:Ca2+-binding EF-hand superfamily protein